MNGDAELVQVSDVNGQIVDIIHRKSDAGMWIVRRRKRILWWKVLVSRLWFNEEQAALAFARGGFAPPTRT